MKNNCQQCNGLGYLKDVVSYGAIPLNDPYRKKHIERCDTCEIFYDDKQAVKYYKLKKIFDNE
jgi:hypothetical protein